MTRDIIEAASKGIVSDTWYLLHGCSPSETDSNLRTLLRHPDAMEKANRLNKDGHKTKLYMIIQSAIQRQQIMNQYYLDRNFNKLLHELRYELHHDATAAAVTKLLDDDMMTDVEVISVFDHGLMNTNHINIILDEYDDVVIGELFHESRWLQLTPIIGDIWFDYYDCQHRKIKGVMQAYAMWSWEQGYEKLARYIHHMERSGHDLHTFYCHYRKRILANSHLLGDEDKKHDTWFLFLSNKSNIKLLTDKNDDDKDKDMIPVHTRIRCLIHHRLIDELLEYDDMDLIRSCMTAENLNVDYVGFWIRLLSKQMWQLQKAIMGK
jgi:hypothetical protein